VRAQRAANRKAEVFNKALDGGIARRQASTMTSRYKSRRECDTKTYVASDVAAAAIAVIDGNSRVPEGENAQPGSDAQL
jgi:hypothetical protein